MVPLVLLLQNYLYTGRQLGWGYISALTAGNEGVSNVEPIS